MNDDYQFNYNCKLITYKVSLSLVPALQCTTENGEIG
jgi:hypothetical protein